MLIDYILGHTEEKTTINRKTLYRRLDGMNDISKWLVFISVNTTKEIKQKKPLIFIFRLPHTKCQVLSYYQELNQLICHMPWD